MDSVSIINKILDANGFYCYKASKRSVAIVKSSRMPEIKLGDIVKTVNNISTMSMTQSVLASTMQTKLNSVEIFSPDEFETPRRLIAKFKSITQEWDYDKPCLHCSCIYLKSNSSRSSCCNNGKFMLETSQFPKLFPLPQYLHHQAVENIDHFSKWSACYNKRLSIAATGVSYNYDNTGHGYERLYGPHAVKIQGRTYHTLPSAATSKGVQRGLSFMVFDSCQAIEGEDISIDILRQLKDELCQCNEYAMELNEIGTRAKFILQNPDFRSVMPLQQRRTSVFEVGAIVSDSRTGQLSISFKLNGGTNILNGVTSLTEPLTYPLLFPFGEGGWHQKIAFQVSAMKYLSARMLMPEVAGGGGGEIMKIANKAGTRILPTNRFQLMARLSQFYLVENLSRIIDARLEWFRKNQHRFMDNSRRDDEEDENGEGEEEKENDKAFLSDSFTGSARHLSVLAHNAMHTVSILGKPTVFITITCNPQWPEIQERLFKGQTAFDRVDITCQVFYARLSALLHNIRAGKYFGGATVEFEMKVIEYQHRGLPHAHVVLRLTNSPNHHDEADCLTWIDKYISATIPTEDEGIRNPRLREIRTLIQSHMTHVCSAAENGCIKNGRCKRGYSNRMTDPVSQFDFRGFPKYRRPRQEDLIVVPHCQDLLLDWEGHINVEFAAKTFSVLYLYKYIFKGNTKTTMRVHGLDETKNEIELYLRGRTLCAMDAMWRTLGHQNYPAAFPSVFLIKVNMPSEIELLFHDSKLCNQVVYFSRPSELQGLTYIQFCEKWNYSLRGCPVRSSQHYQVQIQGKNVFIYSRGGSTIVRLASVPWYVGEKYFLRLLLLNVPARSFAELKHPFDTFQQSALQRNLVKKSGEALQAYEEAVNYATPQELRSMFVMQTLQGFPTLQIFNNHQLRTHMYLDFLMNDICRGSHELALNFLLKYLARSFRDENKCLKDYGLPDINPELETEVSIQRIRYSCEQQREVLDTLNRSAPNNPEQQQLYDIIAEALERKSTRKIFLQGQGGSGKSTFAKKVLALARSKGLIALGCASTGLAAQVYGQGEFETAHSLFGIPVIEDIEDYEMEGLFVTSKIHEDSERFQLLQECSLIVWDEFLSNHQHCYEAASRLLNNFEGKVLLCMGDCRQIAPVVKHSTDPSDTFRASMITSLHWSSFQIHEFKTNMRLLGLRDATDPEVFLRESTFAATLLNIGNADYSFNACDCHVVHEPDENTQYVRLPNLKYFLRPEDVVQFLYPDGFNTDRLHNRAILAGTNDQCDEWNRSIQTLNPGEEKIYLSTDIVSDVDDPNGNLDSMLTEYVLNKYSCPQVPPHELLLKVGDICLVVRTLNSKRDQMSTNTRVQILRLNNKSIQIKTLGAAPRILSLPRIRFKFRLPWGHSFYMLRTQFPLKLAYSMTFNKSQGQEFDKVVLDSIHPVFSHGFLYVGMSRVRQSNNLAFFAKDENVHEEAVVVQNVVYKPLLLNSN